MRRRLGSVLLAAIVLAAAPGLEPRAAALSCDQPNPASPGPYVEFPIVVEGIALSGPSWGGTLASPARFLALRWVRGGGPRIVRVQTAVQLGVGRVVGHMPGFFEPQPGTVARLFSGRARGGVLQPDPCVFDDFRPPPDPPLRTIPRSFTRAAAGPRAWTAHARRGPHGVHCVDTHPVGRHTGGQSECELRRPLLAVHHEGEEEIESTAITVAGPGIAEARLVTPDGPIVLRRAVADRPLLAVLAGHVDPAEVRARVAMADGSVRWLRPVGYPTSVAADPAGERGWSSALERIGNGRVCVGVFRLPPRDERVDPGESLYVDDAPLCRSFGRKRFFHAVSAARAEAGADSSVVPAPERTIVFGAAAPPIRTIVIRDPSGVRRLRPGAAGQFLAVYPASTRREDITVTAER